MAPLWKSEQLLLLRLQNQVLGVKLDSRFKNVFCTWIELGLYEIWDDMAFNSEIFTEVLLNCFLKVWYLCIICIDLWYIKCQALFP